jgi:hypothetical protein
MTEPKEDSRAESRWKRFLAWLESAKHKGLLAQVAVLFGFVFCVLCPLGAAVGLVAVYLRWVPVFVVPTCAGCSVIFVLLAVLFKPLRGKALRTARNTLAVLVCFWIGALIFGILCGTAGNIMSRLVNSHVELPLGEPKAVAVDTNGLIYCIGGFYKRLQVYDTQGRFLHGWFVPHLAKSSFILKIDSEDRIHMATFARPKVVSMVFARDGSLLETTNDAGVFSESAGVSNLEARDRQNNIYRLQRSLFFPRIVKAGPQGVQKTVVANPLNLWLVKGSFPLFLFVMGAGAILLIVSYLLKKTMAALEK